MSRNREESYQPTWLKPQFENIPVELRKQLWAVWRAEKKFDKEGSPTGKWGKAPRSPKTGLMIGADKPTLFATFEEAKNAYETGSYTGVGVLLAGNGITGVDIDDAVNLFEERPQVRDWVKEAIKSGAYCEMSPSNTGLRIFFNGKLNGKGRKVGGLEIYDDKRFLTVTGVVKKWKGVA